MKAVYDAVVVKCEGRVYDAVVVKCEGRVYDL